MEEVDRPKGLDDILKECGRSLQTAPFTISIHPQDQGLTYLLVESRNEKVSLKLDYFRRNCDFFPSSEFLNSAFCPIQDSWLYHLSVAAGTTVGKIGTEFEQLVGKLYQQDGDPSEFCSSELLYNKWTASDSHNI